MRRPCDHCGFTRETEPTRGDGKPNRDGHVRNPYARWLCGECKAEDDKRRQQ